MYIFKYCLNLFFQIILSHYLHISLFLFFCHTYIHYYVSLIHVYTCTERQTQSNATRKYTILSTNKLNDGDPLSTGAESNLMTIITLILELLFIVCVCIYTFFPIAL